MPELSGSTQIFARDTSVVDTVQQHNFGTRAYGLNEGDEYIYLQGVASTVVGDWVTYDEAGLTTRVSANGVGPVAVAMAAIVASRYGWYQISGVNTVALAISGGGAAADQEAYLTSTAGQIDDVDVSGDLVTGVLIRVAESSGIVTVQLSYPFVYNVAID